MKEYEVPECKIILINGDVIETSGDLPVSGDDF